MLPMTWQCAYGFGILPQPLKSQTICTSPNHRLEDYKVKDAVIERIGFRLNEKKKNKWTDERNDAHIGEVRVKISVRD